MHEPDDDPWAPPRADSPSSSVPASGSSAPLGPGAARVPGAGGPGSLAPAEHLEGGDETSLAERLRSPAVLGPLLLVAGLAGALLLVVRPWQPSPSATAPTSSASVPPISVGVVSTGSTGTVLPDQEPGWGAARMEMRVDLVRGDSGRVLGIVGPGVASPTAIGPPLQSGASSITLAGATFRCPQLVGATATDFGLSVEVRVGAEATRVVAPLAGTDGPTWLGLVQQACTPPSR